MTYRRSSAFIGRKWFFKTINGARHVDGWSLTKFSPIGAHQKSANSAVFLSSPSSRLPV
jgi:hypothetical protein